MQSERPARTGHDDCRSDDGPLGFLGWASAALAPATFRRYLSGMTDTKPTGPFTLTPPRILLLVLGAIALVYIVGALMGGVANYAELRDARDAASSASASSPGG